MAKLSAIALALTVTACAPNALTPEIVDARVVLPDRRLNKSDYVRHYLLTTITSDADLPFTTLHSFTLPEPRVVWVGAYARTPSVWTTSPADLHVVERREQFPEFVHGGCEAVNIVADAYTGETLGSWCNVDDGPPVGGMPRRLPFYLPPHSPLR